MITLVASSWHAILKTRSPELRDLDTKTSMNSHIDGTWVDINLQDGFTSQIYNQVEVKFANTADELLFRLKYSDLIEEVPPLLITLGYDLDEVVKNTTLES